MAWSTPTSRSNGYIVPDTEWDKNTVDNPIALRAGEIAISGQAANDLIIASSATQLGRVAAAARGAVLHAGASGLATWLAAGTSGYILTAQGAGADPVWAANTTTPSLARDVSAAVVENTTTETTVFTSTLAANSLSTNRMVRGSVFMSIRSAAARTITLRLKFGATTVAAHAITLGDTGGEVPAWFDFDISALGATNAQCVRAHSMAVNSASNLTGTGTTVAAAQNLISVYAAAAIDSTANADIVFTVQPGTAEATLLARVYAVQLELI